MLAEGDKSMRKQWKGDKLESPRLARKDSFSSPLPRTCSGAFIQKGSKYIEWSELPYERYNLCTIIHYGFVRFRSLFFTDIIGKGILKKLDRGTQRQYGSKPLKHSIVKRFLVFKR